MSIQNSQRRSRKGRERARRDRLEIALYITLTVVTILAFIPLLSILSEVFVRGFPGLNPGFFLKNTPAPGSSDGGIFNALVGSVISVGIAVLIAGPIGILSAIFAVELVPRTIGNVVLTIANILSGLPSIIAGVWTYLILIQSKAIGFSPLAGGVALSVIMLPMIVRSTAEALEMVPDDIRAAAFALGAHDSEAVLRVVLPAAQSGITTGVLLAIARATGETAPLVLTVLFSPFLSFNVTKPMATLSVLIYNFGSMPYPAQQTMAWTASLVLVAIVLMLNVGVRLTMSSKK